VEGVGEGDDALAAGRDARDLDGVLDRLGAGVDQEGLLRRRVRGDAAERLGHLDVGLVHADREAEVLEAAAWRWTASTTLGCEWPTFMTAMPTDQSR
jgi:hypothetical protein